MISFDFSAHPAFVAQGLRLAARSLLTNFTQSGLDGACAFRLTQCADDAEALLHDARRLVGADQHDHEIVAIIGKLRDAAYAAA